jgi:hypothetical protein
MSGLGLTGFLAEIGAGDPSMGLLAVMLGALILVAIYAVVMAFRPVKPKAEAEAEKQPPKPRPKPPVDELLKRVGIDEAMTRIFEAKLKQGLKTGLVRPALANPSCDGWVTYDFVMDSWVCMSRSGVAYPLGGEPAGETVVEEEEPGETAKGGK